MQLAGFDLPAAIRVEHRQISRRTCFQPPGGQAKQFGGMLGDQAQRFQKAQVAVVDQFQRDRQQGFQTDAPAGRIGEGRRFMSSLCGQ